MLIGRYQSYWKRKSGGTKSGGKIGHYPNASFAGFLLELSTLPAKIV